MTKAVLITYAIIALLVLFVGQNVLHQFGKYKAQIEAAKTEKAELVQSREALLAQVASLTAEQDKLQAQIAEKDGQIGKLRQDVAALKSKLEDDRAEIVRIRSDDDSVVRFKKTFPEFAKGMSIVERQVPSERVPTITVPVNYVMLPVGFVDHFIDLKVSVDSLTEQTAKLSQLDALQQENRELLDKTLALEREKSAAYYKGYEEAFEKYLGLSDQYLKLLKEKRFSLGSSVFQAIGGFVGGIAIGAGL